MFQLVVLSSLLLPLLAVATPNITAIFGNSLSPGAEIFLPSQANYSEDVIERWTTYEAPSYIGAIKPAIVTDIQNIVSPDVPAFRC
jgi:fumiquinazoline A oxidase